MKRLKGFTLVELVITIAIVIILSIISVPIYRGYVDKAKWTEAYALFATILSAQKSYYSEYGNFLSIKDTTNEYTCFDPVLGIDARANKYFTCFAISHTGNSDNKKYQFWSYLKKPAELITNANYNLMAMYYNITTGTRFSYDVN